MSLCVVCCSLANVFCNQDQAFLCKACDTTIHSANIISRGHKRVPVCELCKRSAATVFCQQDEAFLCGLCEGEVHSALPSCLPHTVVPVDQALAQRAGAQQLQTPAPAAAAEDACSEHCGERPEQSTSQAPGSQSNDSSSMARVPDMAAGGLEVPAFGVMPAGDAPMKASWGKDIEALDIDAAWLSGFDAAGFDFSDILGVPDIPMPDDGLVPAAVPPADDLLSLPVKQQQQQSMLGSHSAHASNTMPTLPMMMMMAPAEDLLAGVDADDFVVPSFLPDDEEEAECLDLMPHASTAATHKRSAADFMSANPAAAMPPAAKRQQQHHMEMSAAYTPAAPVPPPAARPAATPIMPPSAPAAAAPVKAEAEPHKYSSPAQQQAYLMNGANLTREQRVARYREKRKNRKFHKTIRYASRKAYAEVRPRIKGRFATKEEVEAWKMQKAQGLIPQDAPCMPLS